MEKQGMRPAVIAWSLYLANLLLLPGLAFVGLLWVWHRYGRSDDLPVRRHVRWTMGLSLTAGLLLVIVPLATVLVFGAGDIVVMSLLVYFVTAHACCVFPGIFGLAKAMAMND